MTFEETIEEVLTTVVRRELARAQVDRPAPYPIAVSIADAAGLLSVGRDKIRELIATGRLRTLELGGARVVIPTIALFELDPHFDPADHPVILQE